MLKRIFLMGFVFFFFSGYGRAQSSVCPLNGTLSPKLVCVIPQVYGAFGLGSGPTAPLLADGHQAHFEGDFLSSFGPINEAVGIQVSQLPIASPSSGISFTYDATLKTFAPSTDESLGPILGERASTIGRHKLYVAFSFQYFNFNSIDGQNTAKLPAVFQHEVFPPPFPAFITACANQSGLTGTKYDGNPCFVRDFIQTTNNIDLRVHQYTIYATYGLTRHLDFSIEIPILNVSMNTTSTAQIVPNSVAPAGNSSFPGGVFHQFNPTTVPSCAGAAPCLNATFSDSGSATGVGDITLRGKYEFFQGEKLGVAAGVDLRLPTGDEENFLGAGAYGVKPFGVISYSGRISPHVELGYERNGNSLLAGNFVGAALNSKGSLPNRFIYTLGADVSVVKRLTAAFDLYGQRLFGVPQLFSNPYTDLGTCSDVSCSTLTPGTTHPDLGVRTNVDYNIINGSFGLKYKIARQLVLTGNVLVKFNDSGLRASTIPLVGASYTF